LFENGSLVISLSRVCQEYASRECVSSRERAGEVERERRVAKTGKRGTAKRQ
jgi:hypothetical protein